MPLFARIKGRVSLTDAGRRIAPLVANAFETLERRLFGAGRRGSGPAFDQHRPDPRHDLAGAAARRLPGPPSRSRGAPVDRQPAGRFLDRRVPRRDPGRPRRLAGAQVPFPVPPELQPDLQRRVRRAAPARAARAAARLPRLSPRRRLVGATGSPKRASTARGRGARSRPRARQSGDGGERRLRRRRHRDDDADVLARRARGGAAGPALRPCPRHRPTATGSSIRKGGATSPRSPPSATGCSREVAQAAETEPAEVFQAPQGQSL